jgi:hypothetical protein
MLQSLFAVPILVTDLGLTEPARLALCERALTAYRFNNLNAKPWSRATRESLAVQVPESFCVGSPFCRDVIWDPGRIDNGP